MKKTILFVAVLSAISFASCKKERACTCTSTTTFAGSTSTGAQTKTYKDVTKKQAKTLCVGYTTTDGSGAVTTVDCKLN